MSKKQLTFKSFKEEIINRCKNNGACQSEFKRVLESKKYSTLLEVLKENMSWCLSNDTITIELLDRVNSDTLVKADIYFKGEHEINVSKNSLIITLGSSSATIKTWGSSSATIKTLGSSSATIETWDSSSATIKTWGSSSATIKTWDSSSIEKENKGVYSVILDLDNKSVIVAKELKVIKQK